MKGFAMLEIGKVGWVEKPKPVCGPMDAVCRPLAAAVCTSDVHTVWEGAVGERHDMILGHECCAEVVSVGELVRDFKPGDRVLVPAITPDWSSLEAQAGFAMHSGGMLAGWKFSNIKNGVFSEFFHVNDADGNLAHLPEGMDITEACMLSDMVPTGFHGAELADVQFGDTVLVVGIGPVGLMAVAGAALRGAARILAVGTRPVCVEAARKYGATDFISYKNGPIDEQVLAKMKPSAALLNFSRAELCDTAAVLAALQAGRLRKYVIDFPTEAVIGQPGVIALPHLGASMPESEDNCADMAALQTRDYLETGSIRNSVNLPACELEPAEKHRITVIHKNIPNMIAQITAQLAGANVNIEHLVNKSRKDVAYTVVDSLDDLPANIVETLSAVEGIIRVRVVC